MQASLRNLSQGPHPQKPTLYPQISLPNPMKKGVVRRNTFSFHIIFTYIHVSSDSRHWNYWEQARGLVKKKKVLDEPDFSEKSQNLQHKRCSHWQSFKYLRFLQSPLSL